MFIWQVKDHAQFYCHLPLFTVSVKPQTLPCALPADTAGCTTFPMSAVNATECLRSTSVCITITVWCGKSLCLCFAFIG